MSAHLGPDVPRPGVDAGHHLEDLPEAGVLNLRGHLHQDHDHRKGSAALGVMCNYITISD